MTPNPAGSPRQPAGFVPPAPVRLCAGGMPSAELQALADSAAVAGAALQRGDLVPALDLARGEGARRPVAGSAAWLERLATLGAVDLSVARVVEPHVDAVQILAEAGEVPGLPQLGVDAAATWGVFAAEGPQGRLTAEEGPDGWTLSGVKPWCSLAGELSHALVTAGVGDGRRGLFAVRLDGVTTDAGAWHARGLSRIVSATAEFPARPAVPVGGPQWYLERPGFAWGGIGVAAVWFGGAVGVARRLAAQSLSREPDQVSLALLGQTEVALESARLLLADAAAQIEGGDVARPRELALRTRHGVHDAAEAVLTAVAHGCGPGPLSVEEDHARRVADLQVYVRQDHAERDAAALGEQVLAGLRDARDWHA